MTIHHQVPRSRGGLNGDNKREWQDEKHEAYHQLYGNSLPHEALAQILLVHWNSFTEEFRNQLADVLLGREPSDMYRRELYRSAKEVNRIPDNIRKLVTDLLDKKV